MQYVELNQFQNEFRELSNKFQENEKIIQVNFDELQIIKMFSLSEKVKLIHFDWENVSDYDSEELKQQWLKMMMTEWMERVYTLIGVEEGVGLQSKGHPA